MTEVKYCPKCHMEAYRVVEEGDKIRIVQGGQIQLSIDKASSVSFSLNCPNGHPVKLEIGKENSVGNG
ncbi:hypothetical protein ES708_02267 [subsurface metagenome]